MSQKNIKKKKNMQKQQIEKHIPLHQFQMA